MAASGARSWLAERVLLTLGLASFYFSGYYAIGLNVDPARARTLYTVVDDFIPFFPEAIFLYAWVYTAFFFPAFVVRSPALFRRVAGAYGLVIAIAFACYAAFPVTAVGLRPDLSSLGEGFAVWGLKLNYFLDPPYNLFPSVHLAAVTLGALVSFKARRIYGALGAGVVAMVAVAICATKQHYAVDGVAGLGLAAIAYIAVVRSYRGAPGEVRAFGWAGPSSYLALHLAITLLLYAAFRAGFAPWE